MGKVVEFRESPGPSGPIFWYLDKGLPWIDAHTLIVSLGVPADEMGQLMLSRTCKEDRGMAEEGELPSGESVGSRPVLSLIGAIAVTCDKSAPNFQAVHDWLSETFLPEALSAIAASGRGDEFPAYKTPASEDSLLRLERKIDLVLSRTMELRIAGAKAPPTPAAVSGQADPDGAPGGAEQEPVPTPALPAPESVADGRQVVRMFLSFALPQCRWDLLPFSFLYALYSRWAEMGGQELLKRGAFIDAVMEELEQGRLPGWTCPGRGKPIRPAKRMSADEPLLSMYGIIPGTILGRESYTGLLREGR